MMELGAHRFDNSGRLPVIDKLIFDCGRSRSSVLQSLVFKLMIVKDRFDRLGEVGIDLKKNVSALQPWQRICTVAGRFGIGLRNFKGLLPVNDRTSGSPPQEASEKPQSRGSDEKRPGEPSSPPFGRIPMALFLRLGSNGVLIWGLLNLDKHPIRGAGLCGLGVLMFISGIGLMLTLSFSTTWGWWT